MIEILELFLQATIRLSIPLLIAALGETFSQRSGVFNLGLEGMILMGSFGGFAGVYFTGSLWFGVFFAMVAGGLMGLLMIFMSASLRSDQTLTGVTIGILSAGLVGFLLRPIFGGTWISVPVSFESVHIPLLSEIPVLGQALFQHNILTYLGILLVPILAFVLFRTDLGLKIRAVGENPQAADTLGVNVYHIRYLAVILTGVLAGFAGAYVSLAYVRVFSEGIIARRGWIALALVTFGRRSPYKILAGALLFGFVDALQIRLQGIPGFPIPYEFLLMMPYILSIVFLVITVRSGGGQQAPKALGVPYKRE